MKPFVLLAIVSCLAIVVRAQPTITSSNMYAIGDELKMQNADTSGVSEGAAGANQTWDYSNLTNVGSVNTQTIVSPSSTPYATSFPSADLALNAGSGSYGFFDVDGSDLFQIGFAGSTIVAPYTDPQKFLSFPITYNSTFTDAVAASYEINGYDNNRTGTVTFLADGYGTLMTPSGTFNDVLRAKIVQNFTDVLDFGPFDITTTTVSTTYVWMKEGNKNALMDISNITSTSSGLTIKSKSVFYYPGAVSVQNPVKSNLTVEVFPNPVSDYAMVSFNAEKAGSADITIWNLSGQIVKSIEVTDVIPGVVSHEVSVASLPSGTYLVKVDLNGSKAFAGKLNKQ